MSLRLPALTVGVGLFFACAVVPQAFAAAQAVSLLTTADRTGGADPVRPTGTLLFSGGLVLLWLSQAFVIWVRWVRPSARFGGVGLLRLAQRKVDGREPFWAEDVPELRSLAADRIARSRAVAWAERISACAVMPVLVGIAMAPPVFGDGVMAQAATQAVRYLGVALVLVALAGLVASWRRSTDVKAEAFLERSTSDPEGGATLGRAVGPRDGVAPTEPS